MENLRKYLAECIGTFFLVFVGTTTAVIFNPKAGIPSIVGIALAFGLALMMVYYTFGRFSGGHVNPAVSLAKFFDNQLDLPELIGYIIAQIVGAILGSLALLVILKNIPNVQVSVYGLGANGFGSQSSTNFTLTGALFTEIILTAMFVLVVLGVTSKGEYNGIGGFVIGLALTVVHLIGIPLTGTSVNPARSLAPALVLAISTGKTVALSQVWVFIVAPLIGALLATIIWKAFNLDK